VNTPDSTTTDDQAAFDDALNNLRTISHQLLALIKATGGIDAARELLAAPGIGASMGVAQR
jgi:hypothetical protein